MDLFLVYSYHDADHAGGLGDDLARQGLVVGGPLPLWEGQQLLPPIDQRLHDACQAIVIISRAFLQYTWTRTELDGLATRSEVVALLSDVGEAEVARHSRKLAVAAFPGSLANRLVRLIRPEDAVG